MTTKQRDEIEQAKLDVSEAEAAVAVVEQGILDGDPSATAARLVAAEDALEQRRGILSRALDLRRQRRERDAERARLQRIDELDGLMAEHFGRHEGDLVDLFEQAVKTLTPFVTAVLERNGQLDSIRDEMRAVEPLPVERMTIHGDGSISAHGARIANLDAVALVAEVAVRALHAGGQERIPNDLTKAAQVSQDYDTFDHYGIERGGLVGPSNRLRNLARTVAGDPPPAHVPRPKPEDTSRRILPDEQR